MHSIFLVLHSTSQYFRKSRKNEKMAQLPNPQALAEYNFRKKYSRFKLWISFKNGRTVTFYGQETAVTFKQIICGHIKEVVFDRKAGYLNCIKMAEEIFKGKYITAIIFSTKTQKEIRKYVAGNIVEDTPMIFTEANQKVPHMYVSDSNGGFHLEAIPAGLQFKQILKQQLD